MSLLWVFMMFLTIPQTIEIEGEYIKDHQTFVYGAYQNNGYLLCYDEVTETVYYEILYSYHTPTNIIYLADVLDGLIFVARSEKVDILVKINHQGEILKEIVLDDINRDYHNHHGYLIIEDGDHISYLSQDMVIRDELNFLNASSSIIDIQFQGDAYVNDVKVSSLRFQGIGIYDIKIVDGDYRYQDTITIYPEIIYHDGFDEFQLLDDMMFDHPIQVFSNGGDIVLNGEVYLNDVIDETGTYRLEIYDQGQLLHQIEFKIYPKLEGIEEGRKQSQSFFVFGDAYLNQEPISGYVIVDEPGEYQLEIYLDEEIYQRISFVIEAKPDRPFPIIYVCVGLLVIGILIKLFKK